jgi:nucleoside-diphosphate-sugar epimerase
MTPTKILVTGATGTIGSRLCERLTLHYRLPYRALVRNFTRAVRIARLGTEMVPGDLARPETIEAALEGCDAVLHLAHSDDRATARETINLLAACRKARVKRLVHISSIGAHGPDPGPECAREETAPVARRYADPYCDSKARAEHLVRRAAERDGLEAVILRPTVVYGPHCLWVAGIVAVARGGHIALLDGGSGVCNAVYVDDVCDAIRAAVARDEAVGKAMFINGDDVISWGEFIAKFAAMVRPDVQYRDVSSAEVRRARAAARPTVRSNLRALVRVAASPELHRQLEPVPALYGAIGWTKRQLASRLSVEQKFTLKGRLQGAPAGGPAGPAPGPLDVPPGRLATETCRVAFSNELAKATLGWRPAYDFAAGAELTRQWMIFAGLAPGRE